MRFAITLLHTTPSVEYTVPPRLYIIEDINVHLFVCGSYTSAELKQEHPSLPPTAYSLPSRTATPTVLRDVLIAATKLH